MILEYFEDWAMKEEFSKEFISLWPYWLGRDEFHKLDEVTEIEWSRFNKLISRIYEKYEVYAVDIEGEKHYKLTDLPEYLPSFEEAMDRGQFNFSTLIIPSINAVLAETWDHTFILYHKNNGAVESLKPLIEQVDLFSFSD